MTSNPGQGARFSRRESSERGLNRLLLILIPLTVIAAVLFFLSVGVTGKADIFYVHWLGYRLFEPSAAQAAIAAHADLAAGEAYEIVRREASATNYPVISLSSYFFAQLTGGLTQAVLAAHTAAFLLGLAIAMVGFCRARSLVAPVALTVSVMALAALPVGPSPSDHLMIHPSPLHNLINLGVLVLSPGEAFSPLGFWPKSSLALVMLAALSLRWAGQARWAYVLLFTTMAFHISLGGLLLAAFLMMDLLMRPRQVDYRLIVPMAVAGLLLFSLSQWRILADTNAGWFFAGVVTVGVVACRLASRWVAPRMGQIPVWKSDSFTAAIATIVLVPTAMVAYAISATDNPWGPQSVYLQLAARMIVLAFSVVLLGLSCAAVNWLHARHAVWSVAPVVVTALIVVGYGAAGSWWWQARTLEGRMHPSVERQNADPVTAMYYNAVRDLQKANP
ncbi:MAG: hypothetical protein RLQ25_01375 [Alphaproteobacteria bacterium]